MDNTKHQRTNNPHSLLSSQIAAYALSLLLAGQPLLVSAQTIIANKAQTQQLNAANGVPIINIATPSAKGVSHNQFHQFNIEQQGLILNNAQTISQTQLAGFIEANPNLQNNGAANVIINEVISPNRSQLNGYSEVAGQAAAVVIANPYGITCDGCGFINTPRATLTTGIPTLENGALTHLSVHHGNIAIEGLGLNATNVSQFDIISRSTQINAELHAQKLELILGSNHVDYPSLATTITTADPDDKPIFALDSSALGGMYANSIRLIGTEAGVGVRTLGNVASTAGQLSLNADGKISINHAQSAANITLISHSDNIDINQQLRSEDSIQISAHHTVTHRATSTAANDITIDAAHLTQQGTIASGVTISENTYQVNRPGQLTLTIDNTLSNTGKLLSGGRLAINTHNFTNQTTAQTNSQQALTVNAHTLNNQGDINSVHSLQITLADQLNNNDGTLEAADTLTIEAASLTNASGTMTSIGTDASRITTTGTLDNSDGLIRTNANDFTLTAANIDNTRGTLTQSGTGSLTLTTTATTDTGLDNQHGIISSNGNITLTTGNASSRSAMNNTSGTITANNISVTAGDIINNDGLIEGDSVTLTATGSLTNNNGTLEAADTLTIEAASLSNASGTMTSIGTDASRITTTGTLDNSDGLIRTNANDFTLTAANIDNTRGTLTQSGTGSLTLTTTATATTDTGLDNQHGIISSNGTISVTTGSESNRSDINNTSGEISATNLNLTAGTLTNNGGLIQGDTVTLTTTGNLDNQRDEDDTSSDDNSGLISALSSAADSLKLTIAGWINNSHSTIQTNAESATITSIGLANIAGSIIHAGSGTLTITSYDAAINNTHGTLQSYNGAISVTSGGSLTNNDGTIEAKDTLTIEAASLSNASGTMTSIGTDASRITTTGTLDNSDGLIRTNANDFTLTAANIDNTRGTLTQSGTGSLTLTTTATTDTGLDNQHGIISSNGTISVTTGSESNRSDINNTSGEISATNLNLTAGTLTNNGGLIEGDTVTLTTTGNLDNQRDEDDTSSDDNSGLISTLSSAADSLKLTIAGWINNSHSTIQTNAESATISSNGLTNIAGHIIHAGSGTLTLTQTGALIDNTRGELISNGSLAISSGSLDNSQGNIKTHNGSINLTATGSLTNNNGTLEAADTLTIEAASLSNASGTMTSIGTDASRITTTGTLDNSNGTIRTNANNITVNTSHLLNNSGTITHFGTGDFTVSATEINNRSGTIESNGRFIARNFSKLYNTLLNGKLAKIQADHIELTSANGTIDNTGGRLIATGTNSIEITANTLTNNSGTVDSNGNLDIEASQITNTDGLLQSNKILTVDLPSFDFSSGIFNATDGLIINTQGDLTNNTGNQLLTNGLLTINTDGAIHNYGEISSLDNLTLTGSQLTNYTNAIISADNNLTLTFTNGTITNEKGGRLSAGNNATLTATSLKNTGIIAAANNLQTHLSTNLDNYNTLFSGNNAHLYVGNTLTNHQDANIFAINNITIAANANLAKNQAIVNQSATIEAYSGDIDIASHSLSNTAPTSAVTTTTQTVSNLRLYSPNVRGGLSHITSPKMDIVYLPYDEGYTLISEQQPLFLYLLEDYLPNLIENAFWNSKSYKRIPWVLINATITQETADTTQQAPAKLLAGGNLSIQADTTVNQVSLIAADGDITITGNQLNNKGQALRETVTGSWSYGNAKRQNLVKDLLNSGTLNAYTVTGNVAGTIAAGGALTGSFSDQIDNINIRQNSEDAATHTLQQAATNANGRGLQTITSNTLTAITKTSTDSDITRQTSTTEHITDNNNNNTAIGEHTNNVAPLLNSDEPNDNLDENRENLEFVSYNPVDNLNLPQDAGLFVHNPATDHPYLIETNPQFTDYTHFISSDYLLEQMGVNPEETNKRLGDGFYETRLVRDAVFASTGQRYLTGQHNDQAQFQYLMDNAIAANQRLELSVGIALTAEQVARLTHDIIWLVEQQVAEQTVLVPMYYAAAVDPNSIGQPGALMTGNTVSLSADNINNQGQLAATQDLNLASHNDINNRGSLTSGGNLSILAQHNMRNRGGLIRSGGNLALIAREGDINIDRDIIQPDFGSQFDVVQLGRQSQLDAEGDIRLQAGRDIVIIGSEATAAGAVSLSAERDIAIEAIADKQHRDIKGKRLRIIDTTVKHQQSNITAGDTITLDSGNDIALIGSSLDSGGDIQLNADGDTRIESVQDSDYHFYYKKKKKSFGRSKSTTIERETIRNIASSVTAEGDVLINVSQQDGQLTLNRQADNVTLIGSTLEADNDIIIAADKDITAAPGIDYDYAYYKKKKSGFGGLTGSSHTKISKQQRQQQAKAKGGENVNLTGGDNVVLIATEIAAENGDIDITAEAGKVVLATAKDSDYAHEEYSKTGAFKWEAGNEGHLDETVRHTELTAGGDIRIDAGNGVIVEYKQDGSLTESIDSLSQLPEMAWMAQLKDRDDVNWQAIEEVHDKWQQHDSGIGGPGVTLIALAVAVAMPSNLFSLSQTATSGTLAASIETAYISAIDTLASQAIAQTIASGGDLGQALKNTLSVDNLKNVIVNEFITTEINTEGLNFTQAATQVVTHSASAAVLKTAINGGSFADNLQFSAVSSIGSALASEIGQAQRSGNIDTAIQLIAHGAVGCGLGAGTGGDCASGAVGAVAGELAAKAWLNDKLSDPNNLAKISQAHIAQEAAQLKAQGVDIARLAGGLAALATGNDIDTASQTAGNAAKNNALATTTILLAAAVTAYLTAEGEGNPDKGLQKVGALEDTISQAVATGVNTAVEFSAQHFPEATKNTLDTLAAAGELANTTFSYIDDKTGNTVSSKWSELSPETQNRIKGGFTVVTAIVPVGATASILTKTKNLNNNSQLETDTIALKPDNVDNAPKGGETTGGTSNAEGVDHTPGGIATAAGENAKNVPPTKPDPALGEVKYPESLILNPKPGQQPKPATPESVATDTTIKYPQKNIVPGDITKRGDWAKLSGQLRDAAKGKGNFGIGSGSREQAEAMGKAWVGDGYKVASDGKTMVSKDGLRQYRPPTYKNKLGKTQANFEQKLPGQTTKGWQSNGHLDIID